MNEFMPPGYIMAWPIHTPQAKLRHLESNRHIYSPVLSVIPTNYLIFQQATYTDDSVSSGKFSEKAKLTEMKSYNSKSGHTVCLLWLETWKLRSYCNVI